MFEKFGEFDSYVELNAAAKGFKDEGDEESLYALAKENGIDEEDAQDYLKDMVPELCNELMAAVGKLKVECEELKVKELMEDWTEYIKTQCVEDRAIAAAVRRKDKSLKECIAKLMLWAFSNQQEIPVEIQKAAKINAGKVTFGIPGMATAKRLITEYYLGGGEE